MWLLLFQQTIGYMRRLEVRVKVYFFLSLNWQDRYLKRKNKNKTTKKPPKKVNRREMQ